jgi:hypothetical protein
MGREIAGDCNEDVAAFVGGRTNERGASGAGRFGTQNWRKMKKSRWLSSSSARAASTSARFGTGDASGDLPQEGDQSELFSAAQRESER